MSVYRKCRELKRKMRFDVIIGNPPYHPDDLYLDFIAKMMLLPFKYMVMITPAKWQGKNNSKNQEFRSKVFPYMRDIKYYPCVSDVFSISLQGGVTYFCIDRSKHRYKRLSVDCCSNSLLSTAEDECLDSIDNIGILLHNSTVHSIVRKVVSFGQKTLIYKNNPKDGNYNVAITNVYSGSGILGKDGSTLMLIEPYIQCDTSRKNSHTTFCDSFHTEFEARSYISYLNTKFIRFLFYIACCSCRVNNDYSWRYVPDPGVFNHMYSDTELYDKYKLSGDEILLIASVIKER